MARESGLEGQVAHDGQGHAPDVASTEGPTAQAQDLETHAIPARLGIPSQITPAFESAQNVAGGTLGNVELATDCRVASTIGVEGNGFQHGQGAFNRYGGRFG